MNFVPEIQDSRTYVSLDFLIDVLEVEFDYSTENGFVFEIK